MSTNFPAGIDSYADKVDNVTEVAAAHVNNLQDAVEAIEAKVGIDGSADTGSQDYKIANATVATDTIWDAAGDLAVGTGADTAAKLAIGAANLSVFVDAAGSAIEWASGVKHGSFTIDETTAPGTQEITGVGFLPRVILFFGITEDLDEISFGVDDGTTPLNIHRRTANSDYRSSLYAGSIVFHQADAAVYWAYVTAIGSDGFTLTWAEPVGAKVGTANVRYIAFR